mmetsp:Transcript_12986/g.31813  ORF Transcript_12986/g.31813 Transcript_12986/m.31813 type:complete len:356 (-) Transcript_12986:222-1289(-)
MKNLLLYVATLLPLVLAKCRDVQVRGQSLGICIPSTELRHILTPNARAVEAQDSDVIDFPIKPVYNLTFESNPSDDRVALKPKSECAFLRCGKVSGPFHIAKVPEFGVMQDFTIAFWIRASRSNQILFSTRGTNYQGWLVMSYGKTILFQMADDRIFGRGRWMNYILGSPMGTLPTRSARVIDGRWHHVAITVERSKDPNIHSGFGAVIFYVDGQVVSADTAHGQFGSLYSGKPLRVGEAEGIGGNFEGLLDEFQLFNQTLSPELVQQLVSTTPPRMINETNSTGTECKDNVANNAAANSMLLKNLLLAALKNATFLKETAIAILEDHCILEAALEDSLNPFAKAIVALKHEVEN